MYEWWRVKCSMQEDAGRESGERREKRYSASVVRRAATKGASLAGCALHLFVCTVRVCASPVSSPKLHLMWDVAHVGSRVGGACWSVWWKAGGTRRWWLWGRLTDLPWAVASVSKRDLPSNHLQETGVWEDNYKYSCQRRHVSIDALEWDQQQYKDASGRDRKTGETW